jgi:adenosylcobinamide kinase/adenosylcobinamide-phosphate guanylyltransferase
MWLLNTLEWSEEELMDELEKVFARDANVVFVLNDVGSGVIPAERFSRTYVDRSGIIGQRLAQLCDEVYEVKLGLEVRLK